MKKSLRAILLTSLVTFATFSAIIYVTSSCNRDKCKTIVCANGGVCNGGNCICPTGYEGVNCETVSITKFTGNWQVDEKSGITLAAQYGTVISADPDPTKVNYVRITNFQNHFTQAISAYVVEDTLFIPNQNIQGYLVVGTGFIQSSATYGQFGSINLYYKVVDTATNNVFDYGYYTTDGTLPSVWIKQ